MAIIGGISGAPGKHEKVTNREQGIPEGERMQRLDDRVWLGQYYPASFTEASSRILVGAISQSHFRDDFLVLRCVNILGSEQIFFAIPKSSTELRF